MTRSKPGQTRNARSRAIVQSKATQFDGPFFSYLTARNDFKLEVYYTDTSAAIRPFDPELNRHPTWDNDAISGYTYRVYPKNFWQRVRCSSAIVRNRPDLIILSGARS